mmetsp:Transcript_12867/g.12768  ORF Transcript_12867/g.12768 Transcript_12867/m.12768 type:complete len:144 (+) Transcript_12867:21-452(+)
MSEELLRQSLFIRSVSVQPTYPNPDIAYYTDRTDLNRKHLPFKKMHSLVLGSPTKKIQTSVKVECKTLQDISYDSFSGSDDDDNQRFDKYGNPIMRGGNHRISFADKIAKKHTLSEVYEVESFKRYNTDVSQRKRNESCCTIF